MATARASEPVAGEGEAALDSIAQLNRLRSSDQTGLLRLASGEWGGGEIYLLGGTVIACSTGDDHAILERALVSIGALSEDLIEDLRAEAEDAGSLADLLADDARVSADHLADAEAELFKAGLLRLLGPPNSTNEFETRDAVFPRSMQFGVDIDGLLEEIEEWRERTQAVFGRCDDKSLWQLDESSPLAAGVAGVLGNLPRTMPEVLTSLGANRFLATERAALLLAEGGLIPVAVLELDDAEEVDDSGEDARLSLAEPDDLSHGKIDISLDSGEFEIEVEPAPTPAEDENDGRLSAADYEKAAQGGFIKSYEVLDKVDLSGVQVLGTGTDPDQTRPDGIAVAPLFSLGEIEAIGDDELEMEVEALEDDSDLPDLEISRGPAEESSNLQLTPFETGEFEAVFDEGSVDADEEEIAALALELVSEKDDRDALLGAVDANATQRFDETELRGFAERIRIFSNIFRIIFATFAEHIGTQKARQRFNALLGSSQRQYPELFRRLKVDEDGSIEPVTLINNLAACPPGDYGSLLHQGLYELIFSHLYDAKDLLPGDAETKMMEKIVVFERQIHEV
jgi:hypothetical protein